MNSIRIILCLAVIVFLVGLAARAARADEVLVWNQVALDTIRGLRLTPPRATRTLAMVHVAIFDAVNGIDRVYEPYYVDKLAPPGACLPAAAAMAAYTVLGGLHPERRAQYDAALADSLAGIPSGPAKTNGKAWGQSVGEAILRLRQNDGADAIVPYVPSDEIGMWRPTPPAFAPALLPQWPFVRPFAMYTGDQFRVEPPPPLSSAAFAAAYDEVKELGRSDSEARTAEQTEIAFFWEDGAGSVSPPGHWQVIAQDLARRHRNDMLENARLFALLSIAQADGAISSWDSKYAYEHFRPITAITEDADQDGNPATELDPTWTPLIPTPPFPSYTSGHSTFSSVSARILARFYGTDTIAFAGASPDAQRWPTILPGVMRRWTSLSQAAEEAGQSRIYGGIHWQYDNQPALAVGRALGNFVFDNLLRPLECRRDRHDHHRSCD
jgi:PAP2 superfamily